MDTIGLLEKIERLETEVARVYTALSIASEQMEKLGGEPPGDRDEWWAYWYDQAREHSL